jgi:FemAB-related protein (PEP-CTERM system-associated)
MSVVDPTLYRDLAGYRSFARKTVSVAIAADRDASEWDRYATGHPDASGYHVWAWRGVFARAFGHESIYLVARDGAPIAAFSTGVHQQPRVRPLADVVAFLNYGGIAADSPDAADVLVAAATEVAREQRCRHVELRHVARRFPALPCKEHKVAMQLRLETGMWHRLDHKVRNQIRKAQKSDLTSEYGGVELLADFYRVFARNMRDLGTPVYGRRFFEEVLRSFPEMTQIHVVRLKGVPVAGGITYQAGRGVEVPWASSVRDYNALCPNNLLYWSVIERAVADGCDVLDFGRSTPHGGTYKFKEQWGARPVPLHWEYALLRGAALPNASPTNPKFQLAIKMWKKLPVSIATRVGPSIVRAIP